ncbi:MAG: outer membrane beta-barrel protein [Bacteroidales bacterium]|nr:outer membrane beta-barrel protein [Bacteroidales bacterium]
MVRKITTLVALVSLFTAFNAVKAQEEEDKASKVEFSQTIHQGETLKLGNFISVVSKEGSKGKKNVKICTSTDSPIIDELDEELNWIWNSKDITNADTIFVLADSVLLEKKLWNSNGNILDERFIVVFTDNNRYSLSYANVADIDELATFTTVINIFNKIANEGDKLKQFDTINLNIEELNKDLEKALNKYHKNIDVNIETPKKKKDLLDINLAFGVGYLNWANNGFYSVPQSSDPFSLKYGLKTDIILQFIVFPKSLISISTGIGQQSNIFEFRNGFDNYEFATNPTSNNYSIESNSLTAYYITVPLTIDFNLNKDFRIHIGAMGGINYNTSWSGFVRSYKENGETTTQQSGSAFSQFNPFKLDAMFGISFDQFTFYANYALTDMFESTYKFQARPFSFGLMIWY